MGVFWQSVKVDNPDGGDFVEVDAMVDARGTDSMFPASLLAKIHFQPVRSLEYTVADGRKIEFPYGPALVNFNGESWSCPVVFGPNDNALLGATALEIFNLLVDPVSQSLRPADAWPLGRGHRPTITN